MAPISPNSNKEVFKNIETDFDTTGKPKHAKKENTLLPKILSVLAAFALWLYVFQAVEETRVFKEIPITVENFNTNLGLDVVSGYENTVDVTITGTKSILNDITSKDIKATVDLSDVTERGTYVKDLTIDVPTTVKVADKNVTQLKISVDKTIEKQIELSPVLSYNIQYPYELGAPVLSTDTVTLKGPETDINAVSKALLQLNVGSIKNAVSSNVEVTLYDSNNYEIQSKYIVITPSEVEINVPVYKTVLYGIQPDLVIDKDRFDFAVSPSALYLKGSVNDVESVIVLKTQRAWIDAPGEYELTLALPENVTAYSSYTAEEGTAVTKVTLTVTEKPTQETQSDNTGSANG